MMIGSENSVGSRIGRFVAQEGQEERHSICTCTGVLKTIHDVLSKLKFCGMRVNKEKVTEACRCSISKEYNDH
jgi:hypothetical protein